MTTENTQVGLPSPETVPSTQEVIPPGTGALPSVETPTTEQKVEQPPQPASGRIEDTPQFKALQSAKDREVAEIKRQTEELRRQNEQFQQALQFQRMQSIEAQEQEAARQAIAQGQNPNQVNQTLAQRRMARQQQQYATQEQMRMKQQYDFVSQQAKPIVIAKLAERYKVEPELLTECESPIEAERLARAIQTVKGKLQAQGKKPLNVDSGLISSGGGGDDKSFLAKYARGESDDHARAQKIFGKL